MICDLGGSALVGAFVLGGGASLVCPFFVLSPPPLFFVVHPFSSSCSFPLLSLSALLLLLLLLLLSVASQSSLSHIQACIIQHHLQSPLVLVAERCFFWERGRGPTCCRSLGNGVLI